MSLGARLKLSMRPSTVQMFCMFVNLRGNTHARAFFRQTYVFMEGALRNPSRAEKRIANEGPGIYLCYDLFDCCLRVPLKVDALEGAYPRLYATRGPVRLRLRWLRPTTTSVSIELEPLQVGAYGKKALKSSFLIHLKAFRKIQKGVESI